MVAAECGCICAVVVRGTRGAVTVVCGGMGGGPGGTCGAVGVAVGICGAAGAMK